MCLESYYDACVPQFTGLGNGDNLRVQSLALLRRDIDEGAKHLLKLREKVDTKVESEPAFLAIITYTGLAYRRKDGIYVIPIGCLGP